ncbi:A/G-specific adenine glycosylase [Cellulomonas fimi]|uniref:A/G-specific adenine glycosylase n=1 Tax=Cellulomonas fimi TaxID=1708 RepID=UPI0037BFA1DC
MPAPDVTRTTRPRTDSRRPTATAGGPVTGALAAAQASALRSGVVDWFAEHARDLPWRAPDRTPWGVLVSEVMLQQTPVVRVLPAWTAWTARWPTPADLAAASPADVLRAWDRLGYPRRALRLQECARAITEHHGGVVPDDEARLRALPGIGAYTAAAVVAFAFGGRSVVLDTNVRRVLARTVDGAALPAPSQSVGETARAAALVPPGPADAARWAAASMELGALVCTARAPRCEACPVAELCAWRLAGRPPDEHAARRRTQAWAGTDRQVRGRVMALLRDAPLPVPGEVVDEAWPDRAQLRRCVAGLVADGLVEEVAAPADDALPAYRLPLAPVG